MFKFIFIIASSFFILQHVKAECNVCNQNGVACITESLFNLCFNGQPAPSMTFACPKENTVCTNNNRVCMNKTLIGITPACGDTANCGKCGNKTDDGKFTCTSRTTFSMCLNGKLSAIRGECPKNQLCDVNLAKNGTYPCVPKCRKANINLCDLLVPIDLPTNGTQSPSTITAATSTTVLPTTTANPVDLVCSQQLQAGRYPFPKDTTCQKYISCFKRQGMMQGRVKECTSGLYFFAKTRSCINKKPTGCL